MQDQISITPPALREGDTIAFISPSSRLNTLFARRIEKATTYFQSRGFHVKVIFDQNIPSDPLSAIKYRCHEVHQAFSDVSVKAIICTIGGLTVDELLPYLDYDLIRKNPKVFCGYSDITLLHHALLTKSGLRTFYGPAVIPEFGESPEPLGFTADHFFGMVMKKVGRQSVPRSPVHTMEFKNWLAKEPDQEPRDLTPAPGWKWLRAGKANGRLTGGCLASLVQISGQRHLDDYKGKILILELPEGEHPGEPYSLDAARAAMAHLQTSGALKVIAGLVVGRPYMYDEKATEAFERMVLDQCDGTEFPILAGVDTGHSDPMLTLPLDVMVELDSSAEKDEQFVILEEVVTA
ncbi:peptidase S66, LD-carboxypeptidase A [Aureobasidium subglaciale]|nr:peptidase S66, LD-carboxypeptidase A [Aureobasidium subglaciale]